MPGEGRGLKPRVKNSVGVILMLSAAVAVGVAMHKIVRTGSCSSTSYNQYGPVARCPGGEGSYIGLLLYGIFGMLIGASITGRLVGLLASVWLLAWGVGPLAVGFDASASPGKRAFAWVFGGLFTLLGLIALRFAIRSQLRRRARASPSAGPASGSSLGASVSTTRDGAFLTSGGDSASSPFGEANPEPDAIMEAYAAASTAARPPLVTPPASSPASEPSGDVFDRIAKLAELHRSGALTDDEFGREKAKLLDQS